MSSSTDEMWEGNMRAGRVLTRYEVGTESVGLIETFSRRAHAFEAACLYANKHGVTVTVFDSMARSGQGQLWEFFPSLDGGMVTWKQPTRWKP